MIVIAKYIGGFVRWLFKGCKTSLSDELNGIGSPRWSNSYSSENYVIGYIVIAMLIAIIIIIFFSST
jgi:hypothetical protein